MPWNNRKNHVYYYRNVWHDGHAVKEYFGSGPAAEAAAAQDSERRQLAVLNKRKVEGLTMLGQRFQNLFTRLSDEMEALLTAVYLAAGFHRQDRHSWTKRYATQN